MHSFLGHTLPGALDVQHLEHHNSREVLASEDWQGGSGQCPGLMLGLGQSARTVCHLPLATETVVGCVAARFVSAL